MKKCLLIIDVQNGFINDFTRHIPSLVENLQQQYLHVYIAQFYNEDNSFFRRLINWHKLGKETDDFLLAFQPKKDAIIIHKNIYSCVTESFLKDLSQKNIHEVDICGIDTDVCVTKCAVDLFEAGIKPFVLEKYCASTAGVSAHINGIDALYRFIGKEQVIELYLL